LFVFRVVFIVLGGRFGKAFFFGHWWFGEKRMSWVIECCLLTVSAAHVSTHPKTAIGQLAHARGESFAKGEDWRGLNK
jgi:hypothetical protein